MNKINNPFALHRISLIEPGPVHTEFEAKMIEEVKQREYPGTDDDTLHYFKTVYLRSCISIFELLGQTPDDIARVSSQPVPYVFLQHWLILQAWPQLLCLFVHPLTFLQCIKKVIESSKPRFRNITNPLYAPLVAMKYADETGNMSVHTFYHMLFSLGPVLHVSATALKYLRLSCLRNRTVSPD